MKKFSKWYLLIIMFFLCLIIIPFTLSKYSTTIRKTITLNARQPEYDVEFKRNGLPIGYQEVEYIESTGTQYIDTGIIASDTTGVYAKLSSLDATSDIVYFGSRKFSRFWLASWSNRLYLLRNDTNYIVQTFNSNETFTIKINYFNDRQYVYNDSVLASNIETLDDIPYSMYIFGGNNVGGAVNLSSIRVYDFIVTENNDVIAKYVPCYRISDGEIGLYDIINDQFYTNKGTGTFNKGADTGDDGNVSIDGTMSNQHFEYGTAQNLTANTYTKVGYIFGGWNTKYDGSGTSYTDKQQVNKLTSVDNGKVKLYAQWIIDEAYFDGDNSSSILSNITELTNIKRFEKYTGNDSNVETLINNGTAVKIDDGSTTRSIYAWYDNGTIYWWTDAYKAYLLNKSHYLWLNLTNAEYIDVTGIDTSKVTTLNQTFRNTGSNSSTFEIVGLNNWDTSNSEAMNYMFYKAGQQATTFNIGNIGNWNVSKVTSFANMFYYAGYNATTWNIGDLSGWTINTTSDINMAYMFNVAGYSAGTFDIGNIGNWNVSKVNNFQNMFSNAGYNATTWNIGDLSGWTINTTSAVSMNSMFSGAGYSAGTFNIGNIGNWDVSAVTDFTSMFSNAGYNATTWNSIGTLKVYATTLSSMFSNCPYANGTLNIYVNPTAYTNMFRNAATSGSGIVVNYTSDVTDIDNIIATKSASSNVTKGNQLD